jgi:hypothetical protein
MGDIVLVEGNNPLNVQLVPVAAPVATLYGVVSDAQTGLPLSGVKVTVEGGPYGIHLVTYTNTNGNYGFDDVTPGSFTVTFMKEGYETVVR